MGGKDINWSKWETELVNRTDDERRLEVSAFLTIFATSDFVRCYAQQTQCTVYVINKDPMCSLQQKTANLEHNHSRYNTIEIPP